VFAFSRIIKLLYQEVTFTNDSWISMKHPTLNFIISSKSKMYIRFYHVNWKYTQEFLTRIIHIIKQLIMKTNSTFFNYYSYQVS